jgi:hypothetical protein
MSSTTSFQAQPNISGHIVPDIIGGDNLPENLINILKREKQNIKQGLLFGGGWGSSADGHD